MNVVIFGATGMVGQAALRESLLDTEVQRVVIVVRVPTGQRHPKLHEVLHDDLTNLSAVEPELRDLDACLYCIGISSAGVEEAAYAAVTERLTLAVATTLARINKRMTFVFVSAAGTDSSGQGRVMWARVKGRTENALLRMPFKAAYMFRPAVILPLHGIRSKTRAYRVLYGLMKPIAPLIKALFPRSVTTTEQLGRAMLRVARHGYPKIILESADISRP